MLQSFHVLQLSSFTPPILSPPRLPQVATFAASHPDLASKISVMEIDASFSDTAQFCEKYQVTPAECANTVILEAKRADKIWLAACVILGSTKADVNGIARRTLDARRVSFAPMERAVSESGMEYGAITIFGLPAEWTILVDEAVVNSEKIIMGSGLRNSKLIVPGEVLKNIPNVVVVKSLGIERLVQN